jgi:ligand-binding sensor protein
MLKDGRLTGVKVGNQWRFSREEIDTLLTGSTQSKAAVLNQSPKLSVETVPLRCIQAIQDVFAEILGVGAVTTTPNGEPVTMISNSCRFCHLMLASESGQKACMKSWQRLSDQPDDEIRFVTCHAGLQYARARVSVNGQFEAFLIAGQFYAEEPSASEETLRLKELAEQHDMNLQELTAAAKALKVLDEHTQAYIVEWLQKQAYTIEEIGRERLGLIERLRHVATIRAE